jgi:hypothetical protein
VCVQAATVRVASSLVADAEVGTPGGVAPAGADKPSWRAVVSRAAASVADSRLRRFMGSSRTAVPSVNRILMDGGDGAHMSKSI